MPTTPDSELDTQLSQVSQYFPYFWRSPCAAQVQGWFSAVGEPKPDKNPHAFSNFYVGPVSEVLEWLDAFDEGDSDDQPLKHQLPLMLNNCGDFVVVDMRTGEVRLYYHSYYYKPQVLASSISSFIEWPPALRIKYENDG